MGTQLGNVDVRIYDTLYKLALLRRLKTRFEGLSVALETRIDKIYVQGIHARNFRE